jgi:hypothetical protein
MKRALTAWHTGKVEMFSRCHRGGHAYMTGIHVS